MTGEARPLLHVVDVSVRFGGLLALDRVGLEVRDGEVLGLIGPNGAGKTTLFNVVTRLYQPSSGAVTFNGQDLLRLRPHQVAGVGIARTFQNLLVFGDLTALDNVMVGLHSRTRAGLAASAFRLPSSRREEARMRTLALDALDLVGLRAVAGHRAGGLPFGHQRLLELARALVSGPRLLLLDEPGAGLNAEELAGLGRALAKVRERTGLTLLLIGHTLKLVFGLSDRIVVLDHGQKIAEGTADEVRRDQAVIRAYLGSARGHAAA